MAGIVATSTSQANRASPSRLPHHQPQSAPDQCRNVLAEIQHDGEQRADVQRDVQRQHIRTTACVPPSKAREHQMRGRADGQKFGYALNKRQQRQKCERH